MPTEDHEHHLGSYVGGAIGGAAGVVVGHPFDTIKVQMQTHKGEKNTTGTMAYIREQGWAKGFFRGMSFPVMSYAIINSVFFGVYDYTLRTLHFGGPLSHLHFHLSVFLAGCVGGAAQLLVACPSDVVKVVLQSQIPESVHALKPAVTACNSGFPAAAAAARYYNGPIQCVQRILRTQGFAGLYKGMGVMAARDIPSYGIYLVVFEFIDETMHKYKLTDPQGICSSVLAGGLAGTISWAAIFPLDVLKSRIQADEDGKYRGLWDCVVKSHREEGARVFFRGFVICSLRGFPTSAVTFLVYSQTMKYFNQMY